MPLKDRIKTPQLCILSALVAWVLAWGARAAALDTLQPGSDSILGHVIRVHAALADSEQALPLGLLFPEGWHPPLPALYGVLITSVLGIGMEVIRLASVLLHGVALVQTYHLALLVTSRRSAALLASALVAVLPTVAGWFRTDFSEPLTTVLVLATYHLALKCDLERDRRRALLLGLVVGLGLLTKLSYAAIVFVPALLYLALRVRTARAALNVGLAAAVVAAVAGWWYWVNLDSVLLNLQMSSKDIKDVAGGQGPLLMRIKLLASIPDVYPLLLAGLAGVVLAWVRRLVPRGPLLIATACWAAPVVLFLGLFDIVSRYLVPILPLSCVFAALALDHLLRALPRGRGRLARRLAWGMVVAALASVSLLSNLLPQPLEGRHASGILNPYTGRLDAFERAVFRAADEGLPVLIASAHMQASEWTNNQVLLYQVRGARPVTWLEQRADARRILSRGEPVAVLHLTAAYLEARPNPGEKDVRRDAHRWLMKQKIRIPLGVYRDSSPYQVALYRVDPAAR